MKTTPGGGLPRLSFWGAAGTVTGSRYLLEHTGGRILIDCGLFQGYKQLRLRNWNKLPFSPKALDAVVLTHAHIDHSGYLPALVRAGFRGPIYCSEATSDLCRILLPDSAHLQEEEARFLNKHGLSKHRPALPLYTAKDVAACLKQFRPIELNAPIRLNAECVATFKRAGHLLGSCFVHMVADGTAITFSGDLGREHDPILLPAEDPLASDYVVCESTYGDRSHPLIDAQRELEEALAPTLARGGVVVIPSFAVGRAQTLLLYIARAKASGRLPDIPVFLDSPMAINASALYHKYMREHRLSDAECDLMCDAATVVNSPEASKALDARKGPMIIVSASGMATGGRVLHHLKTFAPDARNLILLAGFQAPGTRGASLGQGAQSVRIHGASVAVRAGVIQLKAASAHADADELLRWLKRLPSTPKVILITHGEMHSSEAFRSRVRDLGWQARVPEHGETIELSDERRE